MRGWTLISQPGSREVKSNNEYFISEDRKYIFYLNEMDGKERYEKLEINDDLYESAKYAKEWYTRIFNIIKDSDHPDKEIAIINLNIIYNIMIDVGGD